MSNKTETRFSLKGMTEEGKKERRRIKQKKYMAKRGAEDPLFVENQRRMVRERATLLRATDDDFVQKHKQYCFINNQKVKAKMNDMKIKLNHFETEKHRDNIYNQFDIPTYF